MHPVHPIVSEARSWLGTRFHHQGRVKANASHRGGVDCLGLLVEVARTLGIKDKLGVKLLSEHDETNYSWLPSGENLKAKLRELLLEVSTQEMREGDIGLFKLDSNPQHVGIFAASPSGFGLVHAYAPSRKVVEVHYDAFWQKHLDAVFRCDF